MLLQGLAKSRVVEGEGCVHVACYPMIERLTVEFVRIVNGLLVLLEQLAKPRRGSSRFRMLLSPFLQENLFVL